MKPLQRKQPKHIIAENIRGEILRGGIQDGEELVQEQLAEMTGMSRMPVREALHILERTGMARRLPNRHFVAVGATEAGIQATFRMLAAMEAELLARLAGQEAAAPVCVAIARYTGDPGTEAEAAIHEAIAQAAPTHGLADLLCQLLNGYCLYAIEHCPHPKTVAGHCWGRVARGLESGKTEDFLPALRPYCAALAKAMIEAGSYEAG